MEDRVVSTTDGSAESDRLWLTRTTVATCQLISKLEELSGLNRTNRHLQAPLYRLSVRVIGGLFASSIRSRRFGYVSELEVHPVTKALRDELADASAKVVEFISRPRLRL